MKRYHSVLYFLLVVFLCGCSPAAPLREQTPSQAPTATTAPTITPIMDPIVEVTFYDLSGFLIRVNDKTILIDAVFDPFPAHSPPQAAYEMLQAGTPPFDDIDVVLTTHHHPDHFAADLMISFLQDHPDTVFISTYQAVRQIEAFGVELSNPIYSINLGPGEQETVSLDGMQIECLYISHGMPDVQNLGFIVTIGAISFFHSGDINPEDITVEDLLEYHLPDRHLDLAFVPRAFLTVDAFHPYLTEAIQARYLVPTHYTYLEPVDSIEAFPNAVLFFDTLETWRMP